MTNKSSHEICKPFFCGWDKPQHTKERFTFSHTHTHKQNEQLKLKTQEKILKKPKKRGGKNQQETTEINNIFKFL
jgi:hypothetical protein